MYTSIVTGIVEAPVPHHDPHNPRFGGLSVQILQRKWGLYTTYSTSDCKKCQDVLKRYLRLLKKRNFLFIYIHSILFSGFVA
jgi:hypothetical protein